MFTVRLFTKPILMSHWSCIKALPVVSCCYNAGMCTNTDNVVWLFLIYWWKYWQRYHTALMFFCQCTDTDIMVLQCGCESTDIGILYFKYSICTSYVLAMILRCYIIVICVSTDKKVLECGYLLKHCMVSCCYTSCLWNSWQSYDFITSSHAVRNDNDRSGLCSKLPDRRSVGDIALNPSLRMWIKSTFFTVSH